MASTESLSIAGQSLRVDGCWKHVGDSLYEFWAGAAQKGGDRDIPHVDGVTALKRRRAATRFPFTLLVQGAKDRTGSTHADQRTGLWTNISWLEANIVDPPGTGDGTRAAVLYLPNGSTKTGNVHVIGPMTIARVAYTRALVTFDISIPAGRLT